MVCIYRACRSFPILHVSIGDRTPRSLWRPPTSGNPPNAHGCKARIWRRIPIVEALRLTWCLPTKSLQQTAIMLCRRLEILEVRGPSPAGSLESFTFPQGLRRLILESVRQTDVESISWSASLQQLSLGYSSNQPITGVV